MALFDEFLAKPGVNQGLMALGSQLMAYGQPVIGAQGLNNRSRHLANAFPAMQNAMNTQGMYAAKMEELKRKREAEAAQARAREEFAAMHSGNPQVVGAIRAGAALPGVADIQKQQVQQQAAARLQGLMSGGQPQLPPPPPLPTPPPGQLRTPAQNNTLLGNMANPPQQQAPGQAQQQPDPAVLGQLAAQAGQDKLAAHYFSLAKPKDPYTLGPGQTRYGASNTPIASVPAKPPAGSTLSKLIAERDALPEGDPKREIYAAAINKALSTNRLNVEVPTKDGPIRVSSGREPGKDVKALTAGTEKSFEGKIAKLEDTMQSLDAIHSRFSPEFQEISTRVRNAVSALKDKAGFRPSPKDRKAMVEYTRYRQDAVRMFSKTLADLSGAAVTESEAKRAKAWMPNAGSGIFDGDSPTEMEAKIKGQREFTQKAIVRYKYYLSRGVRDVGAMSSAMPLENMKAGLNKATGKRGFMTLVDGKWEFI